MRTVVTKALTFCFIAAISGCAGKASEEREIPYKNYFTPDGHIFLQLYDTVGDHTGYWQVWDVHNRGVLTQWGPVGSSGNIGDMFSFSNDWMQRDVTALIEDKLKDGYIEIDTSDLYTMVIKINTPVSNAPNFSAYLWDELFSTGNIGYPMPAIHEDDTSSLITCQVVEPYIAASTVHKFLSETSGIPRKYSFTLWKKDSLLVQDLAFK